MRFTFQFDRFKSSSTSLTSAVLKNQVKSNNNPKRCNKKGRKKSGLSIVLYFRILSLFLNLIFLFFSFELFLHNINNFVRDNV